MGIHHHFDLPRVAGSNGSPYDAVLLDADGDELDITGAVSVEFRMVNARSGAVAVAAGAGSVVSAAGGHIRYSPTAGEVGTAGTYKAQFVVTMPGSVVHKTPEIYELIVTAV